MQRLGSLLPEKRKWELFMTVQAKRTRYLKAGDVVEACIKSSDGAIDLGMQRNRVIVEG
jgi:2,4-diketo-3-deoxy-L-fuconate hydrolase